MSGVSDHQINAELWPFCQSSFCNRRAADSVQTFCTPCRCYLGSQGGEWICRKQRCQSNVICLLWMIEAGKYWVLCFWQPRPEPDEPKYWQGSIQGLGLGALNCAPIALQSPGPRDHSHLFGKITGKKTNLQDIFSSFGDFLKGS